MLSKGKWIRIECDNAVPHGSGLGTLDLMVFAHEGYSELMRQAKERYGYKKNKRQVVLP